MAAFEAAAVEVFAEALAPALGATLPTRGLGLLSPNISNRSSTSSSNATGPERVAGLVSTPDTRDPAPAVAVAVEVVVDGLNEVDGDGVAALLLYEQGRV